MAEYYHDSASGVTARANSTAYSLGNRIVPLYTDTAGNYIEGRKWVWECTTAGTSGASVPTWPVAGTTTQDVTTITDGTAVFTARKPGYSSGTTVNWTFATPYLIYLSHVAVGGDTVYVANTSNDRVNNSAITITWGIPSNGALVNILSCVKAVPVTTLATGAVYGSGSTNGGMVWNGCFYVYGLEIQSCSSTGGSVNFNFCVATTVNIGHFDNCIINFRTNASGEILSIGNTTAGTKVLIENSRILMRNTNNYTNFAGRIKLRNTTYEGVASSNTVAFNPLGFYYLEMENCDWTGYTYPPVAIFGGTYMPARVFVRNCKFSSSSTLKYSGTWGNTNAGPILEFYNCDDGATNYRHIITTREGDIFTDTSVYRTDGASDGETPFSWQMTTRSYASFPFLTVNSFEIQKWVDAVGVPITYTIELLSDDGTLTDKDCWLEVSYPGNASHPKGEVVTTKPSFVASASNLTSSSVGWTHSLSSPVKHSISVTFTPLMKGYTIVQFKYAKPSATVYVCPKITVS